MNRKKRSHFTRHWIRRIYRALRWRRSSLSWRRKRSLSRTFLPRSTIWWLKDSTWRSNSFNRVWTASTYSNSHISSFFCNRKGKVELSRTHKLRHFTRWAIPRSWQACCLVEWSTVLTPATSSHLKITSCSLTDLKLLTWCPLTSSRSFRSSQAKSPSRPQFRCNLSCHRTLSQWAQARGRTTFRSLL